MDLLINFPKSKPTATIKLPGSKSLSNRLLIIDALSGFGSEIKKLSSANDTQLLQRLLQNDGEVLNAEDAGTTYRFLTAYFASLPGKTVVLQGTNRMYHRPIGPLVDALRSLGASIRYLGQKNFPPIKIKGAALAQSSKLRIDSSISSQFVSALLLIAPYIKNGLELELEADPVSTPYIDMTIDLMLKFGAKIERSSSKIIVATGKYRPASVTVEADWSSAVFFYALASTCPVDIFFPDLHTQTLQADQQIIDFCKPLGVNTIVLPTGIRIRSKPLNPEKKYSIEAASCPDLVPALGTALAIKGTSAEIKSIAHLAHKESNRIKALKDELSKCNVRITTRDDNLYIHGKARFQADTILQSYDDHRIAMSLALLSIKNSIIIKDAQCVNKSFPEYWQRLQGLGFGISQFKAR